MGHRGWVAALAVTAMLGAAAPVARAHDPDSVKREVLAFYYGWYTTEDWSHRARWTPRDGAYDSNDRAVVDRQVAEAKKAGITGLIASWWPQRGAYTDKQLPVLLDAAGAAGLHVSGLVEQFGTAGGAPVDTAAAVSDLDYILGHYASHPAWLTVDHRPVLFLYFRALKQLGSKQGAQAVIDAIRAKYPGVILLADQQSNLFYNPWDQADFDGVFDYEMAGPEQGKTPAQIAKELHGRDPALMGMRKPGNIGILTVMPGYDDTRTNRAGPRPTVDRAGGETYRMMWQEAIAAKPDWILITSFNEWLEGSQIEPSAEFGTTALDATARLGKPFLKGK